MSDRLPPMPNEERIAEIRERLDSGNFETLTAEDVTDCRTVLAWGNLTASTVDGMLGFATFAPVLEEAFDTLDKLFADLQGGR